MNVEIQVDVARREGVLTVPVMALRTLRDYAATAGILGIEEAELRDQLGAGAQAPAPPVPGAGVARDGTATAATRATSDSTDVTSPPSSAGGSPDVASASERASELSGQFWVVRVAEGRYLPTPVATGITDLDQVEITAGLSAGDEVLLLPSASLVQVQQDLQKFVNRRFGGIPGITQQEPTAEPAAPPVRESPAVAR
jgi:hypothetical protein